MPDISPSLTLSRRHLLKTQVKVAAILSLRPADFARMVEDLEQSPLFKKLFNASENHKAIHRKKFTRGALSNQFYELDENISLPSSSSGNIEIILESKKSLITLIKKIGQENFEKYFLYANGEYSLDQLSSFCKITKNEIEEINDLLTKVFVEGETLNSASMISTPQTFYTKVAQILPDSKNEFIIAFQSPHMAQGTYQIDHDKIKELKKMNFFSKDEKKNLREVLTKINFINMRKNSLYQLIVKLTEFQKEFISSDNLEKLNPFTQSRMAKEMQLSPSSISRLIANRTIESPKGDECPMNFFFCSRKRWLKIHLEKLFRESAHLTDNEIKDIIRKTFGIPLSRRSVNQYRSELLNGKSK